MQIINTDLDSDTGLQREKVQRRYTSSLSTEKNSVEEIHIS